MKKLLDEVSTFGSRKAVMEMAVAVALGVAAVELAGVIVQSVIVPLLGMILAGKGLGVLNFQWFALGTLIAGLLKFAAVLAMVWFLFIRPSKSSASSGGEMPPPPPPGA